MKLSDCAQTATQRALNPHIYGSGSIPPQSSKPVARPKKRVRQSVYKLNKLESEWLGIVLAKYPNFPRPRAHAVRFRLANGVDYTPDVFVTSWPSEGDPGPYLPTAWEVKGKHSWDDAIVKIKVAAHQWPDIRWILVWKSDGEWQRQEIKP